MSDNGGSRGDSHGRHSRHRRHSRDAREARKSYETPEERRARQERAARRAAAQRSTSGREGSGHSASGRAATATSATAASSRRGRPGKKNRTRQLGSGPVKGVLAAVSAVMLIGGTYGHFSFGNIGSDLSQAGGLNLGDQKDGATDILLVGIDSRTDAHGKELTQSEIDMLRAGEEDTTSTDTIILIRVPNDGSSATAVSIPRDTYVDGGSDLGNVKLNAVYGQTKYYKTKELEEEAAAAGDQSNEQEVEKESSQAGREALVTSVADVTGITVDHYAEVGLLGFVNLTNAVGGVDVCLNNAVDEPNSGAKFPAGQQTLDGQDALSFVRQRYDLPRGDLDRITRQQVYMASLANKVLSTSTLTSPSKLSDLRSAIESSVVLDEGWDVMGLATQMQNLAGGNVTFETIPVTSIDGTGDAGESVVTVDKNQVHAFFDDLVGESGGSNDSDDSDSDSGEDSGESWEDIGEYDPAGSVVGVYNASEVGGLAARVGDLVAGAGYAVGEVGNAAETGVSESQVNVADPNDPAARGLAKQLGGLKVVEDSSLPAGQINVTLSGTYDGPGTSDSGVDEPLEAIGGGSGDSDGDSSGSGDTAGSGDSGDNVGTPGTDATGEDVLGNSGDHVGGSETSEETSSSQPESIDAGGDGPLCVN